MISAQLYITEASSYEQVEFFDFEGIELVQAKQDIRDISKVFTEFSKTFTVPASKKNNQIFKHFYNANIAAEGYFDIRKRVNAQLHLNYNLFKKGRIQLMSANMRGNKPYSYSLTFFGDTVKLAETLGDKTLDTLAPLQKVKIPYTANNVTAMMNDASDVTIGTTTYDDSLLFPLITSTEKLVYDSIDNTKEYNLYPHGNQKGVDYRDLKPALRVHTIIKAIEEEYSNISFSNDFFTDETDFVTYGFQTFELLKNPAYYELFLWLNREKGQIAVELPQRQIESFSTPSGSDEAGMKESTPGYVVSDPTKYQFIANGGNDDIQYFLDVRITPPSSSVIYNFVLKKDGQEYKRYDDLEGDSHPLNMMGNDAAGEPRQALPNGLYTFYIETTSAGTFNLDFKLKKNKPADISLFGVFTATRVVSYTGTLTLDSSFEFETSTLIPNKIKIIDFLAGLFKMFNLTVTEGASGQMKVIPLDTFYSQGSKREITKYIDTTESTVESALPFSEVEFKYDGLDTILASQHEQQEGGKPWATSYYPGETVVEDSSLLNIGKRYEVIAPFEHHKFNRLWDRDDHTNPLGKTSIQWGYSVDDNENSIVGKPLLFYPVRQSGLDSIEVVTGATSSTLTSYYVPSNSLALTPTFRSLQSETDLTPNINFFAEKNEYAGVPFTQTLFEVYYKKYIISVFDPRRRLYKMNAVLPEQKIRDIALNDTIVIFGTEYTINKMTTDLLSGKTSFELLNKTQFELLDKTKEELFTDNVKDLSYNVSFDGLTVDNTVITADLSQSITE